MAELQNTIKINDAISRRTRLDQPCQAHLALGIRRLQSSLKR